MTRNEHITEEAANALMEKNTTKLEETGRDESPCKDVAHQDGSDSGVEMPTRYRYHHRGHQAEGDAEPDSHTDGRQLTPGDGESNGESSLISYDGASENGSESSSIDDTKKNRPNCINIEKVYCAKTNCCRPALSNRSKFASFANESARCRQSTKCDSPTDARRTMRSSSGTRTRTAVSPDAPGGKATVTCGKSKALPYSLSDAKVTSTFETYATLPRRKQKENADSRSPREPSLNRAASLRKKFLENSLMTTSYNSSLSPTASSQAKTMPPYVKARTKTKIYHEISTQTILTNTDVDRAVADSPFKIFNERTVVTQNDVDNKSDKRAEDQELLKKLRKENSKQRTVIEWLEGELSAAKEEKLRLQNRLVAVEQRIYNLLMHKVTSEDVLLQLEREVSSSNSVISKQQKEITELQQLCCIMQKDLDSIHFAQKASEMESLELQEFLQAEKSTLSDSLKDIEAELDACKKRTRQLEEELTNKKNECASLNTVSEQLKLENQTMKSRLATLERRCKELLVHQGAVTSSASVALSGVGSRFEQLLEQLMNTYEISDADLKDDIYQNDAFTNGYKVANDANTSSAPVWLKVISNILSKTSAAKQDCTDTAECAKNKPPSNCSACKSSNEDTKVSSNLTTSDDSFGLSKLPCDEGDSRRNSILSDVYATDDNLTLDFGISESLTDISESVLMRKNLDRFNAESFNHDVSLVEQVLEIDNLVSKVFKAILFIELDGKKTTVSG